MSTRYDENGYPLPPRMTQAERRQWEKEVKESEERRAETRHWEWERRRLDAEERKHGNPRPLLRKNHHLALRQRFTTPTGKSGRTLGPSSKGRYPVRWGSGKVGTVKDTKHAARPLRNPSRSRADHLADIRAAGFPGVAKVLSGRHMVTGDLPKMLSAIREKARKDGLFTAKRARDAVISIKVMDAYAATKRNPKKATTKAKRPKRGATAVQSYLFDPAHWTEARAKAWLRKFGHKADHVRTGEEWIEAEQFSKKAFNEHLPLGRVHMASVAPNVWAWVGVPIRGSSAADKPGYGTRGPRQARLFPSAEAEVPF